ncbi:hypothetical protein DFH29DRAFT_878841 [Suillus ampliporus]|nr:hypothetical protein DFH29DRAFT_878841 [Suillus ampliporus]
MSTPSCLPPLDSSVVSSGMIQLSNQLGHEWLAFYIKLIPTEMIRTELYIVYILLKDRVDPGDLWEFVGLRVVEAQNEELLQNICGDHERRKIAERTFTDAKRARCEMEVYLYSKAIDYTKQLVSTLQLKNHVTVQEKCNTWLMGLDTARIQAEGLSMEDNGSHPVAISQSALARHDNQTFIPIGSSFPLLDTTEVQEAFDETRKAELTIQAALMPAYLDIQSSYIPQRNIQSEQLLLRAKMRRAGAEVEVCIMAPQNARGIEESIMLFLFERGEFHYCGAHSSDDYYDFDW